MDQGQPMKLSFLRWSALAVLALLALGLVLAGLDYAALARLERRLGAVEGERFPAEYFQRRIARGASASDVCRQRRGYAQIRYFMVPLGEDSVIVQRFAYPLVTHSLKVSVLYRDGRVADVDTEVWALRGAREVAPPEARARLAPPTPSPTERAGERPCP